MKVLNLPLSKQLGIKLSSINSYLLMMPFSEEILNHIGTVHGSASYALAEISSGHFLNINFSEIADKCIPILRKSKVKYIQGSVSDLFSTVELVGTPSQELKEILIENGKAFFNLDVRIYNALDELVLISTFEWFVTLID